MFSYADRLCQTVGSPSAIIETQISRDKRVAAADDLIDNSGTLEDLEEKVKGLHQFYLKMAEGEPTV